MTKMTILYDTAINNKIAEFVENKVAVKVYLTSGVKLEGVITENCSNGILLAGKSGADEQIVYKRAIASILP